MLRQRLAHTARQALHMTRRWTSNQPEHTVYSGPKDSATDNSARVTLSTLRKKFLEGTPITVVTAYDYPSAVHVDSAGIDVLLVGDSAGMVVHGHDTTLPISLDMMISHCQAVSRGARRPLLLADMPFGSYEESEQQAVRSAVRILKEANMDAIKVEGGSGARLQAAKAIAATGIAVMGHTGLTPQAISSLGGFKPQGRTYADAIRVIEESKALEKAGCFALLLECVPSPIAAAVTKAVSIPTIGIGAGPHVSGQVLVYHDLLGMMQHPHHAKVTPRFCKSFGRIGEAISNALTAYKDEVESREFPSKEYSPYRIKEDQLNKVLEELQRRDMGDAVEAARKAYDQ